MYITVIDFIGGADSSFLSIPEVLHPIAQRQSITFKGDVYSQFTRKGAIFVMRITL